MTHYYKRNQLVSFTITSIHAFLTRLSLLSFLLLILRAANSKHILLLYHYSYYAITMYTDTKKSPSSWDSPLSISRTTDQQKNQRQIAEDQKFARQLQAGIHKEYHDSHPTASPPVQSSLWETVSPRNNKRKKQQQKQDEKVARKPRARRNKENGHSSLAESSRIDSLHSKSVFASTPTRNPTEWPVPDPPISTSDESPSSRPISIAFPSAKPAPAKRARSESKENYQPTVNTPSKSQKKNDRKKERKYEKKEDQAASKALKHAPRSVATSPKVTAEAATSTASYSKDDEVLLSNNTPTRDSTTNIHFTIKERASHKREVVEESMAILRARASATRRRRQRRTMLSTMPPPAVTPPSVTTRL